MHIVYNAIGTAKPHQRGNRSSASGNQKRPPPPWSILEAATHPKQFGERDEAH